MMQKRHKTTGLILFGATVPLWTTSAAQACSVCFGDPDSSMVRGAASGVLVLGAIVYGLLFGFVGIAMAWTIKARRIHRDALAAGSSRPSALERSGETTTGGET